MIDKPNADRNGRNTQRQARLGAALRENLKRRKSQSRDRAHQAAAGEGDGPEPPDQRRSGEDASE